MGFQDVNTTQKPLPNLPLRAQRGNLVGAIVRHPITRSPRYYFPAMTSWKRPNPYPWNVPVTGWWPAFSA